MGVCASRADEMKNGGRLKYMCHQNANPDNNNDQISIHKKEMTDKISKFNWKSCFLSRKGRWPH